MLETYQVPDQSSNKGGEARHQKKQGENEVSSPVKNPRPRAHTNNAKASKGQGKDKVNTQVDGTLTVGKKGKS
jgi:hypothetical protein